ncbi:hypothetical protein CBR_g22230 [Chara braunii]|uniref:non-specific serine/threonine protein kinase n=1 Tax=Chara braunii TaxID=69332 RepID=A0A388L2L8_CHABU|nr:hypothetical protein CBR_g22230 [Chara braunii]|eukprot:GBG76482.1 hypothetical protein CBR_g22230 [Chara braunii]
MSSIETRAQTAKREEREREGVLFESVRRGKRSVRRNVKKERTPLESSTDTPSSSMAVITSDQWQAMPDTEDESQKPFFQKLYDDAVQREREAAAAARAADIADQVALLRIPEADADRFQEELAAAVAALVRLRTLENLESRITALEQRNEELQAKVISLEQSQLSASRPPNPRSAIIPTSQANTALVPRASGTVASAGTGAGSSSSSTDSFALVMVPNAGTSAPNAAVPTGVQYSGPMVDKRAATLPSKYDGKAYITSWISSMRSYFEVMRTPQEDRSMIMGTNIEPAVRNHIELQAVAAGYERIDLTDWLKASEQHLIGLFTTPDLGMTDVSCMDVVMEVAPKEYLLALKDHATWRELMKDLVNLETKDLARRKKAPAAGGKPQRKQFGSSNQLALHDHREDDDQSYADDLSLDDDLEPDSDTGCSASAIECDRNDDEKLNAFRKTASNKGPNRGSGLLSSSGKQARGVEESSTLSTAREAEQSIAGPSEEPGSGQQLALEARTDADSKAGAVQVLYTEPWEESREVDLHAHMEHWLQLKQQCRVQGSVELTFFKLLVNRRYIRVLIDSGSTTNFFSPNEIRKAGLGMKPVELQNPCRTQVGNQDVVTSTHAVKGVCITFDKDRTVTHELNFYVLDKCPFDADIGLGWLKAHCLRTTWADNLFVVLYAKGNKHTVLLDETREFLVTLLSANKFCRSVRRRKEAEFVHMALVKPLHVPSTFAAFSTSVSNSTSNPSISIVNNPSTSNPVVIAVNSQSNFLFPDEDDPSPEVPTNIRQLLDRFPEVLAEPRGVSERPVKHKIEIIEESVPPKGCVYHMGQGELELRRQIDDMIDRGWIRPSESEFGAPVLFVPKKGGKLRMCIDYHGLNRITRKNAYPLPRIDDLLDAAGGCKVFSKIDLKSGYHQIEVDPSDQHKNAFKTRDGLYEFIVMPFGLTNAPATFQCLMDKVLRHQLNRFVVVYLDDILIFNKTMEEHLKHLEEVLQVLQLHLNLEKSEFGRDSVIYLGHRLSANSLEPEATKVHRHKPYGLLRPLPIPDGPGESISIDFTDMGKVSEAGNSQVMVTVDHFSKFMNLIPLPPHAPTELVIEEFHQQYIPQSGVPKTIVSKDWKDFTSHIYDIKLNKTSGRHPEANGLAEEINQTVMQLLRALIVPDQNTWDKELHKVKGLYNNSIHSATGVTPNQLQYGWPMRNPLSYLFPERSPGMMPDMAGYNAKYAGLLKAATAAMNKRQHAMIKHANKLRKEEKFKVGDYVWVKMSEFSDEEGISRKLLPPYYGPWQILKPLPTSIASPFARGVSLQRTIVCEMRTLWRRLHGGGNSDSDESKTGGQGHREPRDRDRDGRDRERDGRADGRDHETVFPGDSRPNGESRHGLTSWFVSHGLRHGRSTDRDRDRDSERRYLGELGNGGSMVGGMRRGDQSGQLIPASLVGIAGGGNSIPLAALSDADLACTATGGEPLDFQQIEEENQLHLALALSVSTHEATDDEDDAELAAAKKASLGLNPCPADVVTNQYWQRGFLDYGESVVDGFYDLCGLPADSAIIQRLPLLGELKAVLPTDNLDSLEVIIVDRNSDPDLVLLEERAVILATECESSGGGSLSKAMLAKKLAALVSDKMGGPVKNEADLLKAWDNCRRDLNCAERSIIIPVGKLTVGLCRHRALLFKTLADTLEIPCTLVKQRLYSGEGEGSLNTIKCEDESQYLLDLLCEPGKLLPLEQPMVISPTPFGSMIPATDSLPGEVSARAAHVPGCPAPGTNYADWERLNVVKGKEGQEQRKGSHWGELQGYNGGSVKEKEEWKDTFDELQGVDWARARALQNKKLEGAQHFKRRGFSISEGLLSREVQYRLNEAMQHGWVIQGRVQAAGKAPSGRSDFGREGLKIRSAKPSPLSECDAARGDAAVAAACRAPSVPVFVNDSAKEGCCIAGGGECDVGGVNCNVGEGGLAVVESPAMCDDVTPNANRNSGDEWTRLGPILEEQCGSSVGAERTGMIVVHGTFTTSLEGNLGDVIPQYEQRETGTESTRRETEDEPEQLRDCGTGAWSKVLGGEREAEERMTGERMKGDTDGSHLAGGIRLGAQVDGASKTHSPALKKKENDKEGEESREDDMRLVGRERVGLLSDEKAGVSGREHKKADQYDPMFDAGEWEIPYEHLVIGERIGIGSYGEVYKADWHGSEVAVKKFLEQDITGDALEEFKSEVAIMKRLRHPNVVLFMGAVTKPPNMSIVTEFLHRGSLYRLLHRPNNNIDERRRMRMALDVAKGMNYLHSSTPVIVHRDLKSPNLLVDRNWVVKVCDFGLSKMKHNTFLSSRTTAGTPEWMAPEVLRNEPSNEKCDVYSFGVILWELATCQQPWSGMNAMQVVGAVGFQDRRLPIPDTVDASVGSIIQECWHENPQMRPSFSNLMQRLKPLQRSQNPPFPLPMGIASPIQT